MRYIWLFLLLIIVILFTYIFLIVFQRNEVTTVDASAAWLVDYARKEVNELRVMTFNIHYGMGSDEKLDLDRIAQLIIDEEVDIVGLNEVDRWLLRSKMTDQIQVLGEEVKMNYFFSATIHFGLGQYGNGVLASFPIVNPSGEKLPRFLKREQRGLIGFTTYIDGLEVKIIITHLGLNPVERQKQLDFLQDKINEIEMPLILIGDFNSDPTALVMRKFLQSTGLKVNSYKPTFPANNPDLKIDYILTSAEWELVEEIKPISTLSSDHLPLVGTFRLR
ncbi:MAG: endonuclease/exonuclease/phosphatase family protein [Halanaerobiales bacterium]|nr:endonuclease/exonuclease/phosphatase family protein [Halanaerobiales bacterium]